MKCRGGLFLELHGGVLGPKGRKTRPTTTVRVFVTVGLGSLVRISLRIAGGVVVTVALILKYDVDATSVVVEVVVTVVYSVFVAVVVEGSKITVVDV